MNIAKHMIMLMMSFSVWNIQKKNFITQHPNVYIYMYVYMSEFKFINRKDEKLIRLHLNNYFSKLLLAYTKSKCIYASTSTFEPWL